MGSRAGGGADAAVSGWDDRGGVNHTAGMRGERGGVVPWTLLVVGSAASLAANLAVAQPTAGRVIAAWPSFALMRHTYARGNVVRSSANGVRAGTRHQTLRFAPYVRVSRHRRVEPQKQRDVAKIGRNIVDMPPGKMNSSQLDRIA